MKEADIVVIAVCVIAIIISMRGKGKVAKEQESQPINYPELPMDKMYLDIVVEIRKAKNDSDLYAAYMNLLIFETEHGKSEAWLVSNLYEMYTLKEEEIANTNRVKMI